MYERYAMAFRPDSRSLINESDPRAFQIRQSRVEVVDKEADMVQPLAPFRDRARNRAVRRCRLQELDAPSRLGMAGRLFEKNHFDLLIGDIANR